MWQIIFSCRRFEDTYKHKPQIKESANARVNLIGEHTDYTGGYVMPTLLIFKNTVELSKNDEKKICCIF